MRGAFVLMVLTLATAAAARDLEPPAEERVFLEIRLSRKTVLVQESFALQLTIGIERVFFRENLVPLFRRPMDVPLQVLAPGLDDLPGTTTLAPPSSVRARATLALNDDVVSVRRGEDRVIDGRTFETLLIERRYRPITVGEIEIPMPRLRFAYGTEFEDDFVQDRRALDRHTSTVAGHARRLRVDPWPETGRPPSFGGAVGRFRVKAETSCRELAVGESFVLTLVMEGEGNLDAFERPRLDGLAGFHVYGAIDDHDSLRRTIRYDLSPLDASVTEVPAIDLAYLDPGPPVAYAIARTQPVPLTVRPGTTIVDPAVRPEPNPSPEEVSRGGVSAVLLAVGALVLALGIAGALRWRRSRREDRPTPQEMRARQAAVAFQAEVNQGRIPLADAFAGYLAANLRCPTAAVIAPELPSRLTGAGVAADLAARVASLLEELVGSRYGGQADPDGAIRAAIALVDELEACFQGPVRTT